MLCDSLFHSVVYWDSVDALASLPRSHASHYLGPIVEHELGVEGALPSSNTLDDYPRVLIQ
ncbi:hypothetical protein D1872_298890 [compost metagenome]